MALPLSSRLEAILFAAGETVSKKRLLTLLAAEDAAFEEAAEALSISLENRGIALIRAGDELELRTSPEAAEDIRKLRESELSRDLGKASLETLALILYKGGATRTDIDWVRGVNSGAAIRALLMRGLIERTEDASDKRRAFYKPTVEALAHLGATSLEALPRYAEFATTLREQDAKMESAESDL